MKSEYFPFQEQLAQSHREERSKGVSTGTAWAHAITAGLPGWGISLSLHLLSEPKSWRGYTDLQPHFFHLLSDPPRLRSVQSTLKGERS